MISTSMSLKLQKITEVPAGWITTNFNTCPPGAPKEVVERYARVWLWHFINAFLLPDTSSNTIGLSILLILNQNWDNIRLNSWRSAVLSWLHR